MHKLIDTALRALGYVPAPPPEPSAAERLAASMHPNPEYRRRRLAAFKPERVQRYHQNVAKTLGGDQ